MKIYGVTTTSHKPLRFQANRVSLPAEILITLASVTAGGGVAAVIGDPLYKAVKHAVRAASSQPTQPTPFHQLPIRHVASLPEPRVTGLQPAEKKRRNQ